MYWEEVKRDPLRATLKLEASWIFEKTQNRPNSNQYYCDFKRLRNAIKTSWERWWKFKCEYRVWRSLRRRKKTRGSLKRGRIVFERLEQFQTFKNKNFEFGRRHDNERRWLYERTTANTRSVQYLSLKWHFIESEWIWVKSTWTCLQGTFWWVHREQARG